MHLPTNPFEPPAEDPRSAAPRSLSQDPEFSVMVAAALGVPAWAGLVIWFFGDSTALWPGWAMAVVAWGPAVGLTTRIVWRSEGGLVRRGLRLGWCVAVGVAGVIVGVLVTLATAGVVALLLG